MNSLRNSVRLIGNLGQAPEIKSFDSNKKCARFSIAVNESYMDANGKWEKQTHWHPITLWGKQADVAEKYLAKGSEVAIEGSLINRNYTTKDGEKKFVTEIRVNDIMLLGKKAEN